MKLAVLGTNHKFSPVEFRERFYFSKKTRQDCVDYLKEKGLVKGAVVLSTCNRLEIYVSSDDSEKALCQIKDFISQYYEIDINRFSSCLYIYEDIDAARHLFSVACGLDSLVIGEAQILEQVKNSLLESEEKNFIDGFLAKIFYSVASSADKAHGEHGVFKDDVSIGSIAVEFIKDRLGGLAGKDILIIGTGSVIELVAKHLEKETLNLIFVANRTFERAKDFSTQIKARAVRFDKLKEILNSADIVITATRSPHFIINPEMFKCPINHKVLIIDLAMPRDVNPAVRGIKGVELFYLEDLKGAIGNNLAARNIEMQKLEKIISVEAEKLWKEFTKSEHAQALLP